VTVLDLTDLAATLARLQDAARREPAQPAHRVALLQLHLVAGSWDKALRQVEILAGLDPGAELFCAQARLLVAAEKMRLRVFAGEAAPSCLGQPPGWLALLAEALRLDAGAEHAAAKGLREQAFAEAPSTPGTIDGAPFAWIADADERLGPVLEIVVNGRYFWVPFDRLRRLELDPPADLKDLVWAPARLVLANEGEVAGFVPTRYPGTEAAADDALRLARRTEWRQLAGGSWVGLGQRMLATDEGERALLDVRVVALQPAAGDA
jgi:type VI secretion system protein ImpE